MATTSALDPRGHAIEVRLYAEDPANDWQPQSGRLHTFEIPGVSAEFGPLSGPGLRLDSGFESGSEVSTYYDAMLAKLIAWAPTRSDAARLLADALSRARLHGLVTNRDLLLESLRDPAFLAAEVGTDFFDRTAVVEHSRVVEPDPWLLLAGAIALAEDARLRRRVQRGVPPAWRNVVSQPQRTTFEVAGGEHTVEWYGGRAGYHIDDPGVRVVAAAPDRVVLESDGISTPITVEIGSFDPAGRSVWVDSRRGSAHLREVPRFLDPAAQVAAGSLLAPMPGSVVSVAVSAGDAVSRGQTVLVLEAMKMQHTVAAPADGVVTEIDVKAGDQVAAGTVLAVVTEEQGSGGESA